MTDLSLQIHLSMNEVSKGEKEGETTPLQSLLFFSNENAKSIYFLWTFAMDETWAKYFFEYVIKNASNA